MPGIIRHIRMDPRAQLVKKAPNTRINSRENQNRKPWPLHMCLSHFLPLP